MRLTFSLTQSPAARASYPISREVKAVMKRAAKLVADGEIPAIRQFDLSVIALSDDELLEINRASLGHDWYTDVITFEIERSEDRLEAEIYLSVERAMENARKAKVLLDRELTHLVIHGVLHLAGYDDKQTDAKKRMKARERFYLEELKSPSHS
jgi:probable rRNA maturation factor